MFECYKQLGLNIAYNKLGFVAPADFANDANMQLLWELDVARLP